ncbi:cytidylyltransferase domain-containing protein [Thermodesulfobacteriota bacterium]
MNIYTVIPARGGSKSIPKKNIRLLHGKTLIEYSIEYSIKCPVITNTVVSTDSKEIAEIARNCGAEVPFIRPEALAQDDTQDYPVFRHALNALEELYNEQIDILVLLRPTSPLRPPNLIEKGIALLKLFTEASSVRSVTPSSEHPFRQWKINGDYMSGYEKEIFEPYNLPRQQLPPVYFQTGDIEIIRRQTLLGGSISGERVLPLIIKPEEMVDIDNMADWHKAEEQLRRKTE